MTTMQHGTRSTYNSGPCRCVECTTANTAFQRAANIRRSGTQPPIHGRSGYDNYRCRCAICSEAKRIVNAATQIRRTARARAAADG